MSVVIRMSRGGRKKLPYYSIVVADQRAPRDGRFIEKVGTYNPMLAKDDPKRVTLVEERIKAWLAEGAQPSERVQSFLAKAGIMKAPKKFDQTKQHLPKEKAQERAREKEEALKAKQEEEAAAKAEAEEAAKAAAEAPAEEAQAEEPKADATPAEETKAEETKAEEAPAEEASTEKKEEDAA